LENKKLHHHCNSTPAQQKRILDYLIEHGSITTAEARELLDIMHPAGRIAELRKKSINIVTHKEFVYTGKNKHKMARYILLRNQDGKDE
jgi:polyhydroxyalkanoate synthesis regulator phasin